MITNEQLLRKIRSIMNRMSNADISDNEIYGELEVIEEDLLTLIPKTEDDIAFEKILSELKFSLNTKCNTLKD